MNDLIFCILKDLIVGKGYEIFSSIPSLPAWSFLRTRSAVLRPTPSGRVPGYNRLRTGDASPLPVLLAPLEREPGGPPFRNPMK